MPNEAGLFLATYLEELNVLDDQHEIATVAMATIASVYPKISETALMILLGPLNIEENVKLAAIAYFMGAKIIEVTCDCGEPSCEMWFAEQTFWLSRGDSDSQSNAYSYSSTVGWIQSLKAKLV